MKKKRNASSSFQADKFGMVWSGIKRDKLLYIMMIPGLLVLLLFKYVPMYGVTIAFRNYNIFQGFSNAPWVGFDHFIKLFRYPDFFLAMKNTVIIALMKLAIGFPAPVLLSLMINEIRNKYSKKFIQTVVLLPNFISWVVISAILYALFSVNTGAIRSIADLLGYTGKMTNILQNKSTFQLILTLTDVWKNAGYNTIVYLGVMTSIDPTLYEAAEIDGASWLNKIWHITLSGLRPTIIILFIFKLGALLNVGFEQIFVLTNPIVNDVAEILDTYVYKIGMLNRQFTLATAASLFKSIIGMILVFGANFVANKLEPDSGIM